MYVRPSWLKAAGVEVSKDALDSWEEVRAAAKAAREWAVQNMDNTFWGIGFPGDHYITNLMRGTTYSQNGRLLNDAGNFNLTSDEFRNTWNLLVNFIKEDKSAPEAVLGWTWNDYQQAFAMGKLAIIVSSLNTNIVRFGDPEKSPGVQEDVHGNTVEGGDWIALPMPKWDNDTSDKFIGAQPINLSAMIINKYAPPRAKAAAMVLGEVRMSFEGGKNELLIEGNSPFFPSVLEDPEVMQQVDYTDVRLTSLQNSINEVFPTGSEKVMDMLVEYFAIAVTGEMSNTEAIETVQGETEKLFGYEIVD
jgi:ABC-type glycerol-3-phosphate transport system substrate-binding protein